MTTPITIVTVRHTARFTTLCNSCIDNEKLSWKARGLLHYLLHLPKNWKINLKHLESKSPDGKASLASGMKELQKNGYLTHTKIREKGKVVGHQWTVYEEPILKSNENDKKEPEPENRILVIKNQNPKNQILEKPDLENQPLVNTNKETNTKKERDNAEPVGSLSADADDILSFFIQKIKERKPDMKLPDPHRWRLEIDRMIRIDKRDPKKIRAMIDWIHRDSFWSTVILSPEKLRRQYDQIELQALGKYNKNLSQKNQQYAENLRKKYPQSYGSLFIANKFVRNMSKDKEISLNLPIENFKRSFVAMFGVNYDDMSPSDK